MSLPAIKVDVLIAGGGLAGTLAAIAVKRTAPGARVLLVERYGFLGGMATAGYVFPFMRYWTRDRNTGKEKRLVGGLFWELINRMKNAGYMIDGSRRTGFPSRFDPMMLRCILDEMAQEAGVQVLLHGLINGCKVVNGDEAGKELLSCSIQVKRGTMDVPAAWFVDATGDADIAFHAGAECTMGREVDGLVQPATLNFRMGNLQPWASTRNGITRKIKNEKEAGKELTPRDDCLMFNAGKRQQHFNQTRVPCPDFTDPIERTRAEIEGRKQARRFIDFLRSKIRGFKRSTVVAMGTELGVRESRRVAGQVTLQEEDILNCTKFEDRVALGNYPIDIHDPKGSASTDLRRVPEGDWYSIPYGSLVPKNFNNLIVAGRAISSSHVAHSAIRVMPTCAAIGHAAGAAVGLAILNETHSLATIPMPTLQDVLKEQGCILD